MIPSIPDPLEDALRTFPQAAPPPDLARAVMARIRRLAPAPRFRLAWLDYALAFFMAAMGGVAVTLWRSIPATTAQIAESRIGVLIVRLGPAALGATLLSGLAFVLVALAAAAWLGFSLSLAPRRLR
jgi:hypothetical protein